MRASRRLGPISRRFISRARSTAARFVEGTVLEVRDAQAPVRREPAPDAPLDTEALHGERVTVYEENGEGWYWGQLASDGYVGWMPANALREPGPPPTHRVAALRTFVFPGPLHQGAAGRCLVARQPRRGEAARRRAFGCIDGADHRLLHSDAGTWRRSTARSRISSPSPSASSAFLICGAARPASGSIARGWCRSR